MATKDVVKEKDMSICNPCLLAVNLVHAHVV